MLELARGPWQWPGWAIALLGAASVLLGVGYCVLRLRRRQRP
jgi:hypothetical protein